MTGAPGEPSGGPAGGPSRESAGDLLATLASTLPGLVGDDLLELDVRRSMGERLRGLPGRVVGLKLSGPDLTLGLSTPDGRRAVTEVAHVVRGVVLSRRTPAVGEWLDLLAGQLRALATASALDDASVTRALSALGVVEPASDLAVDETDLRTGLTMLPARLGDRVPADVGATVARICELLLATVARVDADPQQAHVVRRAAVDYLPRTLREYVALPPDWAQRHELPTGGTALDALRTQLDVLESAVTRMRDAATEADARQLLANGAFLADRFQISGLDQ